MTSREVQNARDASIQARFRGSLGNFALDVSFRAPMRGITALFGPSGSGKTTVLRCVAGLQRLAGALSIGEDVWQDDQRFRAAHERSIGYVFQEASLFPHLSVKQNLVYGRSRALRAGIAEHILFDDVVQLMGLGPLLERMTTALSGGERQRVAIGRALLAQPRLLLMDEPLAALDQDNKEEILPFFEALHESLSIPILYVSHDIFEVERLADILVLFDNGKVIASGPLAELLADGTLPIARRPDAATVFAASVSGYDEQYHLTVMNVSGQALLIPGRVAEPGRTRRVRIAAADVSLAPERPSQTSILNVMPVEIREIQPVGEAQVNVMLSLGHDGAGGPMLLARISRRASETLRFAAGQKIYAQVKAVSLLGAR